MIEYDSERHIVCPFCGGSGAGLRNLETGEPAACPRCGGRKVVERVVE